MAVDSSDTAEVGWPVDGAKDVSLNSILVVVALAAEIVVFSAKPKTQLISAFQINSHFRTFTEQFGGTQLSLNRAKPCKI